MVSQTLSSSLRVHHHRIAGKKHRLSSNQCHALLDLFKSNNRPTLCDIAQKMCPTQYNTRVCTITTGIPHLMSPYTSSNGHSSTAYHPSHRSGSAHCYQCCRVHILLPQQLVAQQAPWGGWGLYATTRIAANARLFQVPANLLLCHNTAMQQSRLKMLLVGREIHPWAILALFLAEVYALGDDAGMASENSVGGGWVWVENGCGCCSQCAFCGRVPTINT